MRNAKNINEVAKLLESFESGSELRAIAKIAQFRGDIEYINELYKPVAEFGRDEWTLRDSVQAKDVKFTKRSLNSAIKQITFILNNSKFPEYKLPHIKRILDNLSDMLSLDKNENLYVKGRYDESQSIMSYVCKVGSSITTITFKYRKVKGLNHYVG